MALWEMKWIGTPDDVWEVVKDEIAQPIGIYIFGVSEARRIAIRELVDSFHTAICRHDLYEYDPDFVCSRKYNQTIVLDVHNHPCKSSPQWRTIFPDSNRRSDAVRILRRSGCRSTIGIYAEAVNYQNLEDDTTYRIAKFLSRYRPELEPTIDGNDHLITVRHKIERQPRKTSAIILPSI